MLYFIRMIVLAALIVACIAAPHDKFKEAKESSSAAINDTSNAQTSAESAAATKISEGIDNPAKSVSKAAVSELSVEKSTGKSEHTAAAESKFSVETSTGLDSTPVAKSEEKLASPNMDAQQLKSSEEKLSNQLTSGTNKSTESEVGSTVEMEHEPVNAHQKMSQLSESKDEPSETIGNKISEAANTVKETASDAASQVSEAVFNAAKSTSDSAKNATDNVKNGSNGVNSNWALCSAVIFVVLTFSIML